MLSNDATQIWRVLSITCMASMLCLVTAACSSIPRHAEPPGSANRAVVPGFTDIRLNPLTDPAPTRATLQHAFDSETADSYDELPDGTRVYNYLSVSGGGSDGAFGAGLLNGWTKAGDRPKFKVVTGVSTGALIAPFAFLGPDYDETLRKSYTTVDASRIFLTRSLLSMLFSESLTDTGPLKQLVASYIDEKVLDAIAVEYAKGRRLYVLSTNLDAEQPIFWDLGAIASSKNPKRVDLFRTVLVASAAIPAVFPPVMLDVTVDGQHYDEMHVDGGVFFQSFNIGNMIDLPTAIAEAHPDFKGKIIQRLYIIRNGRVTPDPRQIDRSLSSIAVRAIGTMFKVSGMNDLYRLYLSSIHDQLDFHYITIPLEFESKTDAQFNEAEMNRQYKFGEEMALKGIPWQTVPPGYQLK